jgi:hypothetical protein
VLPVADGGYLWIRQAKVSGGKFAFVDCFARFVVEGQVGLVSGVESSNGWHRNIFGRPANVSGLIAIQPREGSIHEKNTGQKQNEEPTHGKSTIDLSFALKECH